MSKRRAPDLRPVEVRREEWLRTYPDKFLACRSSHAFPRPVPGRRMPRTKIEPYSDPDRPARDGYRYVEQTCANCGRIRWKVTGPRGAYYAGATKWKYNDPAGYASPHGLGLTYADYAELYWQRLVEGDQDFESALADHNGEST
jgi:hypothetical protein